MAAAGYLVHAATELFGQRQAEGGRHHGIVIADDAVDIRADAADGGEIDGQPRQIAVKLRQRGQGLLKSRSQNDAADALGRGTAQIMQQRGRAQAVGNQQMVFIRLADVLRQALLPAAEIGAAGIGQRNAGSGNALAGELFGQPRKPVALGRGLITVDDVGVSDHGLSRKMRWLGKAFHAHSKNSLIK